jgi:hypothetical protein
MDVATDLYSKLNTVQDVLALKGKEEDLFVEVKRGSVPMSDDDKEHLSIALSGFANSAGGVLIFGLVAEKKKKDEPDVITREDPIKDLNLFVPEVQSLIGKAVVPLVDGVQVNAVRYQQDPSRGFAVILVPESDRGPHRSMLKGTCKQYYKRSGDSFYVMEHFDLADMFGRRRRPNLCFYWRLGHISYANKKPRKFALILGIQNVGRAIARFPLFRIKDMAGGRIWEHGVDGKRNQGLRILQRDTPSDVTFIGGANDVIHPGTSLDVTALGDYDASQVSDVKFKLILAAKDLEASTQEILIGREEILKELGI